jgi:hypothetical protein
LHWQWHYRRRHENGLIIHLIGPMTVPFAETSFRVGTDYLFSPDDTSAEEDITRIITNEAIILLTQVYRLEQLH